MVSLNSVSFSYGSKIVYDSLNLSFQKGTIYGLLGKNGTGKSTLLKLIAGLVFPKKGVIQVLNQEPKKRNPDFLKDIYLIPEEFNLPDVNITSLIKYYAPFYPNFDKTKFDTFIQEFEVPTKNTFSQMSLGQKKKAIISFGLACNTPLLLMDEPTNGLDIMSKSQFKQVMKRAHNTDQCIIVCTHQAKDLESLINRVTIIDERGVILDKEVSEILSKLYFKISNDKAELANALYTDEYMNDAKSIILSNTTNEIENKLELEMLFKAVISDKSFIQNHLN